MYVKKLNKWKYHEISKAITEVCANEGSHNPLISKRQRLDDNRGSSSQLLIKCQDCRLGDTGENSMKMLLQKGNKMQE